MADDEKSEASGSGRRRGIRMALMVAIMLVAEAALIVGVLLFVGEPREVEATSPLEGLVTAEDEKIEEILVLDAKLYNNKTGTPYLYDTEIYVHVKNKHADRVREELDQFQNEIKAEIAAIWKTSEPHHFQEPKNESLTRKVYALLDERFGAEQETGDPLMGKCIVYMGTGLRIDG